MTKEEFYKPDEKLVILGTKNFTARINSRRMCSSPSGNVRRAGTSLKTMAHDSRTTIPAGVAGQQYRVSQVALQYTPVMKQRAVVDCGDVAWCHRTVDSMWYYSIHL